MNVSEFSYHAVGFIPGDCPTTSDGQHRPAIFSTDRIHCDVCGTTGPLAAEWSEPIIRAVEVTATVERVAAAV